LRCLIFAMALDLIELQINNLSGSLCRIEADLVWTVLDVKLAVEAVAGIPSQDQRLLLDAVELLDHHLLHDFFAGSSLVGGVADVTLVRISRLPGQAEWLAKVGTHGSMLAAAPEAIRADREVVLAAVRGHGRALEFAAEELRADREVVLAAARQNGWSLRHASEELRADREVVLAALRENGRALKFAAGALLADRDVALAAVRSDGLALEFVAEEFRADREVVLGAVQQNGKAVHHVSGHLRSNKRIAWAAGRDVDERRYCRDLALRQGKLHRVIAEGVAGGRIVARDGPNIKARVCNAFERGVELVAEGPPTGDGWLPLHELQLQGPLSGGHPQWVLLDGAQVGLGRLVEGVRGKTA